MSLSGQTVITTTLAPAPVVGVGPAATKAVPTAFGAMLDALDKLPATTGAPVVPEAASGLAPLSKGEGHTLTPRVEAKTTTASLGAPTDAVEPDRAEQLPLTYDEAMGPAASLHRDNAISAFPKGKPTSQTDSRAGQTPPDLTPPVVVAGDGIENPAQSGQWADLQTRVSAPHPDVSEPSRITEKPAAPTIFGQFPGPMPEKVPETADRATPLPDQPEQAALAEPARKTDAVPTSRPMPEKVPETADRVTPLPDQPEQAAPAEPARKTDAVPTPADKSSRTGEPVRQGPLADINPSVPTAGSAAQIKAEDRVAAGEPAPYNRGQTQDQSSLITPLGTGRRSNPDPGKPVPTPQAGQADAEIPALPSTPKAAATGTAAPAAPLADQPLVQFAFAIPKPPRPGSDQVDQTQTPGARRESVTLPFTASLPATGQGLPSAQPHPPGDDGPGPASLVPRPQADLAFAPLQIAGKPPLFPVVAATSGQAEAEAPTFADGPGLLRSASPSTTPPHPFALASGFTPSTPTLTMSAAPVPYASLSVPAPVPETTPFLPRTTAPTGTDDGHRAAQHNTQSTPVSVQAWAAIMARIDSFPPQTSMQATPVAGPGPDPASFGLLSLPAPTPQAVTAPPAAALPGPARPPEPVVLAGKGLSLPERSELLTGLRDADLPDLAAPPSQTRTDTAATVQAPAHKTQMAQLPQTVFQMVQQGISGPIDLALSPDDLGKIRLQMQADGDVIRIFVTAEKADTADLIRRSTEQFAFELRQSGFASASFSFGTWGHAPQRQGTSQTTNGADIDASQPKPDSPVASKLPTSGLDLRL